MEYTDKKSSNTNIRDRIDDKYEVAQAKKEALQLDCRYCFDSAFYCATPTHQIRRLYMDGKFDDCKEMWGNMITCFRASLMSEKRAREFLKGTNLDPDRKIHVAEIFEMREKPGWK